jgi:hypothetical protein
VILKTSLLGLYGVLTVTIAALLAYVLFTRAGRESLRMASSD